MVKPWDRKKLGPSITVWNSTEWCVNWIISWAKIWTVLWSTIKISENLFVTTAGFILIYIPLNLPDGRGWLRGKLGLVLMGGAMLSSVQSLSPVRLFAIPWIAAHQASLSITNFWSSFKLIPIKSVMPSSHLILCHPLLLLPPIPPSIRFFSSESALLMRWPKYWSFSFSIIPSNEHPGLISYRMDGLDLLAVQGLSRVFSNTTVQKHQFFSTQLSSQSNSHIHTWLLEKP